LAAQRLFNEQKITHDDECSLSIDESGIGGISISKGGIIERRVRWIEDLSLLHCVFLDRTFVISALLWRQFSCIRESKKRNEKNEEESHRDQSAQTYNYLFFIEQRM
ncbi:hypothetical protein PFISCL1PPCAC_10990, partial [Pristionchus fissidentatus]